MPACAQFPSYLNWPSARSKPPQAAAVGAAVAAAAAGAAGASALRSGHPLKRCLAVLEQLLLLPAARPFQGLVRSIPFTAAPLAVKQPGSHSPSAAEASHPLQLASPCSSGPSGS
jgi:hypothetical protein